MKKYFLFAAAALVMVSCAKDKDELTHATIKVETSMGSDAKTLWNEPGTNNNITVTFEPREQIDVYEYGYTGKVVFTNSDRDAVQSGNFSGNWHGNSNGRWAAVLPAGASNSVDISHASDNVYDVTLPTTQTTRVRTYTTSVSTEEEVTKYVVSPSSNANIMIGAKNSRETATTFLAPVCTYLYFATETTITNVTVSATSVTGTGAGTDSPAGCMAGRVNITTNGEWDSWDNFVNAIRGIEPQADQTALSINVTGAYTNRASAGPLTEYIVCMYPGTYTGLTISYEDASGTHTLKSYTQSHTCAGVQMYYLGKFTTPSK